MGGKVGDLDRIGVMGSEEGLRGGGDLRGVGFLAGFQQAGCFDDDEANRCAQEGLDLGAGVALFVLLQELGETRDKFAQIAAHRSHRRWRRAHLFAQPAKVAGGEDAVFD